MNFTYGRTMRTHNIIAIILASTITFACGDDGQVVVTTVITNPATVGVESETDAETTGVPAETTDAETTEEPTTGDISTTGNPSTTSTTGEPDFSCTPKPTDSFQCDQAPVAEDFCAYVADACSEHQIEQHYCDIMARKCDDTLGCTVCFEVANYCHQLGFDCDNLYLECGCVADALGVK
jgi:hypothetical protein